MTKILKTTDLTKDFGENKGAFELNISMVEGEIVGFIGPNGAGKSTTLSMLTGLIVPTFGSFELFCEPTDYLNIYKIMPKLGILPSEVSFDSNKTSRKIFTETATLLNQDLTENWVELAEFLDIELDRKFGELSFGNKKKIGIVTALMHKPKLVIMDEPTNGLDPLIQQKFLELIKAIKKNGGSILLSSHVLSEVQAICDRIIMIKNGKVVLEDETKNILEKSLKIFRLNSPSDFVLSSLEKKNLFEKMERRGEEVLVYTSRREDVLKNLVGSGFYDFYIEKPSLEDMFLEQYL